MEWIISNSFIGSGRQQRALVSTEEECDPTACYDSFRQHWQQALKIIKRNQQLPSQDDVLGIVNNLEQMVSLLLYDLKKVDQMTLPISTTSQCLDYLMTENILNQLFEWGIRTGKYAHAVKLEQLKLYEMLVKESRHLLLMHEPFLQPLMKLLHSCQNELFPKQIEKHLVTLLYQLCIVLMQNIDLVDLFFPKHIEKPKFIIFALLIPFMHREDNIGMQARDSLLLCMSLSKKNSNIREYILEHSNVVVMLTSGLGGLYSALPHILDGAVPDWHRLTQDDVNEIKDLSTFVTSLEFSNNVSQMADPLIIKQLQEFIYMGFLIPVLGPALLQNSVDEQIAVMAYLERILRTVTNPGLLHPVLRFLLTVEYDGQRLLDILMKRIRSTDPQLSLVSLALFETLIDLNCEDVMLKLVFHHLQPCLHLMISQRKLTFPLDPHCQSSEKFLNLSPMCCEDILLTPNIDGRPVNWNHYGGQTSLYGNYHAYLCDAKNKINGCQMACTAWTHSYTGCENLENSEENSTSLPSLGESSGYESLKVKLESHFEDNSSTPVWQISQNEQIKNGMNMSNQVFADIDSGTAGPFLTIILEQLKNMLTNSLYINLHLTGLISRLAVYPQPLLRTYLLDHSLVLQPNVPSLFQILGSLKQKIDEFMSKQPEKVQLIHQARHFLVERETRLVQAKKVALDRSNSISSTTTSNDDQPFQRNGSRRSLTQTISSMFGKRQSTSQETSIQLVQQTDESKSVIYPKFNDAQRVAVCAVLLDEWVKELAALAQEHAISQLAILLK
ncbi:PREDICTED: UPF0518 protein AGAP011705 [Nicrophorus vespilloides]|uniref:UPF0518 protein AGAP011705 n=1 Tax=Nicrophorus vespilloides TaxID=110193 RepID=A0ABM1NGX2_NICVS|nr:PREDICTED: UPF0518 protein AGAP011705 [Nicrophorus vespilloides]